MYFPIYTIPNFYSDPDKIINFRLTKIYDMLSRMIVDKDSRNDLGQERAKLYGNLIKSEVDKIESLKVILFESQFFDHSRKV